MKPVFCIPENMLADMTSFIADEDIRIDLVTTGEYNVQVVQTEERLESSLVTLQSGGWIKCATALAMARNLGLSPRQLGKLLDHLHIKVRECGLGCF